MEDKKRCLKSGETMDGSMSVKAMLQQPAECSAGNASHAAGVHGRHYPARSSHSKVRRGPHSLAEPSGDHSEIAQHACPDSRTRLPHRSLAGSSGATALV